MFANPLQALAETCEADNSIFNMNMPLLLLFSLIGATVGGKLQLILNLFMVPSFVNLVLFLGLII